MSAGPLTTRTVTTAVLLASFMIALASSGPLAQAVESPLEARVTDLEKRLAQLEKRVRSVAGGATQISAPFEIVNVSGKVLANIDTSGELTVGNAEAGSVALGVSKLGGFVFVANANQEYAARIGSRADGGQALLFLDRANAIQARFGLDPDGKGQLQIGDGKPAVNIGRFKDQPMGLSVLSDGGKESVRLSAGQGGGTVRVMTPEGIAVGGLFAGANGGGLALTSPAGGKSAVSLSVDGTGGKVRVFPAAGGPAQAELTADAAGGGVTLYTKAGEPAAVLYARTTGAGQLEINQKGEKLVEAGVNANGIGLVLAGPGGRASSIPGVPDSYIIGRKLEK